MKIVERIVWSPEHGGCLMIQRKTPEGWVDQSSMEEGRYPKYDKKARKDVRLMNADHRARELVVRAKKLEEQARQIRHRAKEILNKAGFSRNGIIAICG